MNTPEGNAVLVEALSTSLRSTENGLETIPDLLKRVLSEESWRQFTTPRGELVQHETFKDFLASPPTTGLGASEALLKRIVEHDPGALSLLEQALGDAAPHPPAPKSDEAKEKRKRADLRRLEENRPDLHQQVLAGTTSAHKAMIEAGFRSKTVSIAVSKPESAARTLRRNLSPAELGRLIELLRDDQPGDPASSP